MNMSLGAVEIFILDQWMARYESGKAVEEVLDL